MDAVHAAPRRRGAPPPVSRAHLQPRDDDPAARRRRMPAADIDTPAWSSTSTPSSEPRPDGRLARRHAAFGSARTPRRTSVPWSPAPDRPGRGRMCCQKVGEAEAMVVRRRPATSWCRNEIVGAPKLARLVGARAPGRDRGCVDDPATSQDLDEPHARSGAPAVLVEIDVGMRRCGVAPGRAGPGAGPPRRGAAASLRRPPGLPRPRAAHRRAGGAPRGHRGRHRRMCTTRSTS